MKTDASQTAVDLIRQGRFAPALDALDDALRLDADDLEARGHRAWLCKCLGRNAEAIADYRWLAERVPHDLNLQAVLAECLLAHGELHAAIQLALEILRQQPDNSLAAGVVSRYHQIIHGTFPGMAGGAAQSAAPDYFEFNNRVIRQFEANRACDPASVHPRTGQLLYALIRLLKPLLVLETGCFAGYSTLCLAQGLQDNGVGHLHACDLFAANPGDYAQREDEQRFSTMLDLVRHRVQRAGLHDWITLHRGDSATNIKSLFARNPNMRIDFAFIDGDHRVQGCLDDWLALDPRLVEGGCVLLHDTAPEHSRWLGPRYLLEELRRRAGRDYQFISFPMIDCSGVALLQKQTSGAAPRWKPRLLDLLTDLLFVHNHWRKIQ